MKEECKKCGCKDLGYEPHSFDEKGEAIWDKYVLYCHNCDWYEERNK